MSFRPTGVSVPRAFSKNNKQMQQYPKDRIVDIVEFNLGLATVRVREVDTSRLFDVTIDPEIIASQNAKKAQSASSAAREQEWEGYAIDKRMTNHLRPGNRLVLEACKTQKRNAARHGDEEVSSVVARWIHNVKNPQADKTFRAAYSVNAVDGRIKNVQVWDRTAVNPESQEDLMKELGARLDKNCEIYAYNEANENNRQPYTALGIKLRAIVQTDTDKDGKPVYTVVNTTDPFEWVSAERNDRNEIVSPGHPINKDKFFEIVRDYMDYIFGSDGQPGALANTEFDLDKVQVEVMPYESYFASDREKSFTIPTAWPNLPIHKLAYTPTKNSFEEEEPAVGKNWAVDGIVMLTADKADASTRTFVSRNIVTKLFVNGYMASVHNFVRSSDGGNVRMHPSLDKPKVEAAESSQPSSPAGSSSAPASAPATSNAYDPFANNDPFADGFADAPPEAAPAPAPQVASAPAPQPPAPVAPPATQPPTSSSFSRRR
jgi:hypothetical protein